MGCTWRRARHKWHYGQCVDITLAYSILARHQLNPYLKGAQDKEVEQWQFGCRLQFLKVVKMTW
jgi:hypothetical protein